MDRADKSPKPEIRNPSKSPISNPIIEPGIGTNNDIPDHDSTVIPEELPLPLVFPEIWPGEKPNEDDTISSWIKSNYLITKTPLYAST